MSYFVTIAGLFQAIILKSTASSLRSINYFQKVVVLADEKFRDVDELTGGESTPVEESVSSEPKKVPSEEPSKDVVQKEEKPVVAAKSTTQKKKAAKKKEVKKKASKKKTARKKVVEKDEREQLFHARKKSRKSPRKEDGFNWVLGSLVIIGIVAIVVLALIFASPRERPDAESVVAMVNGVPIYSSEARQHYNFLSGAVNPFISEEEALDQLITEYLLVQKAESEGYSVSDDEVLSEIKMSLAAGGASMRELEAFLDEVGMSYEFYFKVIKNNMLIQEYINREVIEMLDITDEDLRLVYEQNIDMFGVPDMVQVRHILISDEERGEEAAYELAVEVRDMVDEDRENFCELVEEYNEDVASTPNCGEYNYSRHDPFVTEFLEAGFNMTPGELRIVKTNFGYHLMYKVADLEGEIRSFEDVMDDLYDLATQEKLNEEINDLIAELRMDADIEIYDDIPEEVDVGLTPGVVDDILVDIEEPVDDAANDERVLNLAQCLGDSDAVLFKVDWCPYCDMQMDLFGEHVGYLNIVECDPQGVDPDVEACDAAGVRAYPTWFIDGEKIEGMQGLDRLALFSGCEY